MAFCLALTVASGATTRAGAQAESIDVAIIDDGKTALTRATKEALVEQLLGLSEFERTFRVPEARQFSHGWDPERARSAIETALADDSIEIVVVIDLVASSVAAGIEPDKPLVAAAVALPELQGFAIEGKWEKGCQVTTKRH